MTYLITYKETFERKMYTIEYILKLYYDTNQYMIVDFQWSIITIDPRSLKN